MIQEDQFSQELMCHAWLNTLALRGKYYLPSTLAAAPNRVVQSTVRYTASLAWSTEVGGIT